MFYVYVLRSEVDNNFYVGYSSNLENRLIQHEKGLVNSTKNRRPLELVYYEVCLNQQDVQPTERNISKHRGGNVI